MKQLLPHQKLLPILQEYCCQYPHHHIPTHSTKSDVGDSTTSSIASPKMVARFPPKEQVKVDKCSDSEPEEGSRNETAQKRFVYSNKLAGDSGDNEISNMAYRMVDVGIDNKSCPAWLL